MSIDSAIQKENARKEQEFHAIMVRAGVRPEGSRAEDHRPKRGPVEVPVVKPAGIPSEAAE